jgi:hypothetical protein
MKNHENTIADYLRHLQTHITMICLDDPGIRTFGLPNGSHVRCEIKPAGKGRHNRANDTVYLNDACCGNRYGGAQDYRERFTNAIESLGISINDPDHPVTH